MNSGAIPVWPPQELPSPHPHVRSSSLTHSWSLSSRVCGSPRANLRVVLADKYGVPKCKSGTKEDIDVRTVRGYGVATVPLATLKILRRIKRKATRGMCSCVVHPAVRYSCRWSNACIAAACTSVPSSAAPAPP